MIGVDRRWNSDEPIVRFATAVAFNSVLTIVGANEYGCRRSPRPFRERGGRLATTATATGPLSPYYFPPHRREFATFHSKTFVFRLASAPTLISKNKTNEFKVVPSLLPSTI